MTDPRPMFVLALDQTQAIIDTVGADDLDRPTPCPEYDVRTMLGHLVTVVGRINLALSGDDPLKIPTVTTGITDFAGAWKEGRTKVDEAIVRGDDAFEAGIPESFNVLVKEMRALGLNVELVNSEAPLPVEEAPREPVERPQLPPAAAE